MKISSLIFDLDGVITSEESYWDADRLSLWELLTSDEYLGIKGFFDPPVQLPVGRDEEGFRVLSPASIVGLKNRAVNSNWDITYLVFSVCVAHVLRWLEAAEPGAAARLGKRELDGGFITALGRELKGRGPSINSTQTLVEEFLFRSRGLVGPELLAHLRELFEETTFMGEQEFYRGSPLWRACRGVFQGWMKGETFNKRSSIAEKIPLIKRTLMELGVADSRNGCNIRMDASILPIERIEQVFQALRFAGITLAVATGRPREEALNALKNMGILRYFDERRVITQLEVDGAEAQLRERGQLVKLSKPHPYPILKAIYPEKSPEELFSFTLPDQKHRVYAMVGDAMSDILSAKRAGCTAIGVLSGAGKDTELEKEQRAFFTRMGADRVIFSIEELPPLLDLD